MRTLSITVSGRVQGVFFRQTAKEKALELGITGEVRNLPNGDVHILATGDQAPLEIFAAWCRQGPPKARVTDVDIKELGVQSFDQFKVIRS